MKILFTIFLTLHIIGGSLALISGFIAMLYIKGGRIHRMAGKLFFWSMTVTCSSGIGLSLIHPNYFLLMIAAFSYQLVAIGYRSLHLKKLHTGTIKPKLLDWIIGIVPAIFNIAIFSWGIYHVFNQSYFGFTGIVFGLIGFLFSLNWVKNFFILPKEKQHWLFSHFQGFGAAYIATATAFLVVNINFLPPLLVWLTPSIIGTILITLTTVKYKKKFSKNQEIKYITSVTLDQP